MRPRNSERGSHLPKVTQPKRTAESRQPRSSPEPPAVGRLPRWGHGSGCGAVKELHLHPSWLSPMVPKLGSLGGPSKAIYGAGEGAPCCLQPLTISHGHHIFTAGQATESYTHHPVASLWVGFYQPTTLVQTPGMMGFEQVSLLPLINGKPESLYYFTNPVCLLDKQGPWGKQQQEGLFWRECREEFL